MKLNILRCTFSGRNVVLYYLAPANLDLGNTDRVVVPNKGSFAIPTVQAVIPYDSASLDTKAEATEFIVCPIDTTNHANWTRQFGEMQTESEQADMDKRCPECGDRDCAGECMGDGLLGG